MTSMHNMEGNQHDNSDRLIELEIKKILKLKM